jgi:hypothetical protein
VSALQRSFPRLLQLSRDQAIVKVASGIAMFCQRRIVLGLLQLQLGNASSLRRVHGIYGYRSADKNSEWLTLRDAAAKLGVGTIFWSCADWWMPASSTSMACTTLAGRTTACCSA